MKKFKSLAKLAALFAFSGLAFPTASYAVSQNECAIWICLPGGFPSGCSGAYSAMIDRIKDEKSPLPSFGSCSVSVPGSSEMSYQEGYAAYIPEHDVCVNRAPATTFELMFGIEPKCLEWETVPEQYVKGVGCSIADWKDGSMRPAGCTRTVRSIDVKADGKVIGDTYYW